LVELTVIIGFANFATRCNIAQGIESLGFAVGCEVPLAKHPGGCGAASR
jgi:hypothetical protein